MVSWCSSPSMAGHVVTALPVLAFLGFLFSTARTSLGTLRYAGSNLLWVCYGAVWLHSIMSLARTLVELTTTAVLAWNLLALLQSFSGLLIQVCIIALLIHSHVGWAYKAVRRSLGLALGVAGCDAALRTLLTFICGIPLYYIKMCSAHSSTPTDPAPQAPFPSLPPSPDDDGVLSPTHILDPQGLLSGHPDPHTLGPSSRRHLQEVLGQLLQRHQQLHPDMHNTQQAGLPTDNAVGSGAGVPGTGVADGGRAAPLQVAWRYVQEALAALLHPGQQPAPASSTGTSLSSSPHLQHVTHVTRPVEPARQHVQGSALDLAGAGAVPSGGDVTPGVGYSVDVVSGWQWLVELLTWHTPGVVHGMNCLNHRWAAWSYLLTHSLLLASIYVLLLLLPSTPLRDVLPAKRALRTYLAVLCTTYLLASLGALLAGCGVAGGACVWSLSQWLQQVGLAPLLYATFLRGALSGSSHPDGLDEDLLMYKEMRDAGILDDEPDSLLGYM